MELSHNVVKIKNVIRICEIALCSSHGVCLHPITIYSILKMKTHAVV